MYRRSKGARIALLVPAVVLLLVSSTTSTLGLTATPLGKNLVKNPGAEAGIGGNGYTVLAIPNWHTDAGYDFTAAKYGSPGGFPTKAESTRIGGGTNFFTCGNGPGNELRQTMRILGRNNPIDAGLIYYTFKARVATYGTQTDAGYLQLVGFTDSTLNTQTFNKVSQMVTGTNGRFRTLKMVDVMPANTRYLYLFLGGSRLEGDYCDAYFDNVSFVLKHL